MRGTEIQISPSIWDSSIVAHLRELFPRNYEFMLFNGLKADFVFPFRNETAICIIWEDQLMKAETNQRIEIALAEYPLLIVIIVLDMTKNEFSKTNNDNDPYTDFMTIYGPVIHTIVYFDINKFASTAAEWIWVTISNMKGIEKMLNQLIKIKKFYSTDPTIQISNILDKLVKDEERKMQLLQKVEEGNTDFRKILVQDVSELWEQDFYLEPNSSP